MNKIQELKFEELSVKQKIGFAMIGSLRDYSSPEKREKNLNFIKKLVKEHSIGALWANSNNIEEIKAVADYPLLFFVDAEKGLGDYKIGAHNAIGMADSEELAYTFGKVTAITARQKGFTVVCDPVVDMANGPQICGGNIRSIGCDKERVAALAKAVVRGMHDGGVLSVAKHYPSPTMGMPGQPLIDSHMAESYSSDTKESLLEYSLYPYLELLKEDLLDGIMTGHCKLPNIDPDYPASLSKKVIDIIRQQGFDGIALTDALEMMGVVAKFGRSLPYSLCIAAGNDLALPFNPDNESVYNAMLKGYEDGLFTEEDLDRAVTRVLKAQHKVYEMSKINAEITEKDKENFKKFAPKSVFAKTDENVSVSLDKNGKYCFFVLTDISYEINDHGTVDVDTFTGGWYSPRAIIERLKKDFPNSVAYAISQYPVAWRISRALSDALDYDTVFITYQDAQAYIGKECLSSRIISLMEAMQVSDRISTIVHFGNPYVMEDVPHVPRLIIGGASDSDIDAVFDVLEGRMLPEGKLTYNIKLK